MAVCNRYVQPQSCYLSWKFAKLWRINFSLENLDSLVLTCLKTGTVYFGATYLLQRFSKHDLQIDLLFSKIVFLLGICSNWHEMLEFM